MGTTLIGLKAQGFIDQTAHDYVLKNLRETPAILEVARAAISRGEPAGDRFNRFVQHNAKTDSHLSVRRGWRSVRERLLPYSYIFVPDGEEYEDAVTE